MVCVEPEQSWGGVMAQVLGQAASSDLEVERAPASA